MKSVMNLSYSKRLEKRVQKIIVEQTSESQIVNVPKDLYQVILCYLIDKVGMATFKRDWSEIESVINNLPLNVEQRSKAIYIAHLASDYFCKRKTEVPHHFNVVCPYCSRQAEFVDSDVVYGKKGLGYYYLCRPCGAWVGVHKGDNMPLGMLADEETRMWRKKAHIEFDKLWREEGISRKEAYRRVSAAMGRPSHLCHIGMLNVDGCRDFIHNVVEIKNCLWR